MTIKSFAISALATINLHSLNNEGADGNYLQTRQVQIVDENGQLQTVNAISGDMFKHIQVEHLYNIAKEEKMQLCNGCARFDANRIVADSEFANQYDKTTSDSEILTGAIQRCVIDDLEGILITSEIGKKRSIARKSVVECGWLVGKPESTRTESYFHVKYVPEGRGKGSGEETGAGNLGQNIFHRPASSGQYAIVVNVDLYRVGYNDITQEVVLSPEQVKKRSQALVKSILFAFLKPDGAQRNTQHPHVTALEGCITLSKGTYPAPIASALNPNYLQELEEITATLNTMSGGQIELVKFDTLGEFTRAMSRLVDLVQKG